MGKLSRECIHDTLMVKRTGILKKTGPWRAFYRFNIETLRHSQLAPYVETKMRVNRILDMQTQKRAASEIVIVVRGGIVEEVRSTNPYTVVYVADYDRDHDDPDRDACLNEAEERGIIPDMHIVY